MAVHLDSLLPHGARPAAAGSSPSAPNDRHGYLVLRVERYELRPVLDAQGRPLRAPKKDAGGRPLLDGSGQPVLVDQQEAVGVYGTASCSGEKIYMRLSTDEEVKADGNPKGVSSNRHSVNVIRLGAAEGIERGRRGEMADPSRLAPEERPFWRCDKSRFVCDAKGEPLETPDGYKQMRCHWLTAYCNYRDKAGREVDMLSQISSDRYATVSVSLRDGRGDAPSSVNYYGIFADTVRACAQQPGKRFSDACWEAAGAITQAWMKAAGAGKAEHFGRLAVTAWNPDDAVRFAYGTGDEQASQKRLAAWLASPKFKDAWQTDNQGIERLRRSFCQPEILARLLNAEGEVCGAVRVRSWNFDKLARGLEAEGDAEGARALSEPGGRAAWILDIGRRVTLDSGEKVCGMDLLCGECSRASRVLENPNAFGSSGGSHLGIMAMQTQRMIYHALSHSMPIQPGRRRESIGCSQPFITRNREGIVNGFFLTRDACRYRSAVLLGPGGSSLACSAPYAEELMAEKRLRGDLAAACAPVQDVPQSGAAPVQAEGEAQGQIQVQAQGQASAPAAEKASLGAGQEAGRDQSAGMAQEEASGQPAPARRAQASPGPEAKPHAPAAEGWPAGADPAGDEGFRPGF